jgi:hypothetical protein
MWTSFSTLPSREKWDWAGELGPLDPMLAMLANVLPLSRPPGGFQLLKIEGPKGELVPGTWVPANGLRWGIEPARSLESSVDVVEGLLLALVVLGASRPGDGDLNGVCDGLGREALAAREGIPSKALPAPPGGNLDGTVPARARRVCGRLSGVGRLVKSGKASVGDSGMLSRSGVEFPLVGGPPQGFAGSTETPSCA